MAKQKMMKASDDKRVREAICRKALDALKPFCSLDEEYLGQAVLMAMMLSVPVGVEVKQAEILEAINWANSLQRELVMLQFALCGACDISVGKSGLQFAMRSPEKSMQALINEGIAQEKAHD